MHIYEIIQIKLEFVIDVALVVGARLEAWRVFLCLMQE